MKRDQVLLERARAMRGDMPEPERRLWAALRAGRLDGWKFARQVPVGRFIADFAARRERVIVEVDGDTHDAGRDAARDAWLAGQRWFVVRVSNGEVMGNIEGVLRAISIALGRDVDAVEALSPPGGGLGEGGDA